MEALYGSRVQSRVTHVEALYGSRVQSWVTRGGTLRVTGHGTGRGLLGRYAAKATPTSGHYRLGISGVTLQSRRASSYRGPPSVSVSRRTWDSVSRRNPSLTTASSRSVTERIWSLVTGPP